MDLKIHILTLVKDDNEGLNRTLNSIAFQDNPSVEISIIVIDGLSATCPSRVIDKFSKLDIKLIKRAPKGIYNAMNEGLRELSLTCNADKCSVVFLNAGDFLIDRLAVEKLLEAHSSSQIAVGNALMLSPSKRPSIDSPQITFGVGSEYMHPIVYWLPHQGLSAQFGVYKDIGLFDETFKIAGDYEWISRAITRFGEPELVPSPLVAQMTDGVSNKRSYSGYRERQVLAKNLNLSIRKLPLMLVVKMFIKETILSNFPEFTFGKKKVKKYPNETHGHAKGDSCAWCLFDLFSK